MESRQTGRAEIAELAVRRAAVAASPAGRFGADDAVRAVAVLVATTRGVPVEELLRPSRGRAQAASARQLAMYLTHVMLGRSLTEVGALFGRDRTTVAHACALVEDARESPEFDLDISRLEARIAAFGTSDSMAEADRAAG